MSMLSMQIDRLRSCADLYDGTTKPEMAKELQRPYLAQELREAADTIWQLRDDLQRAHRESTELRELVRDMWRFTGTVCKKYPRLFDHAAQGGQMVQLNMIDAFEQRMRELGVDV